MQGKSKNPIKRTSLRVLATATDPSLGASLFDLILAQNFAEKFDSTGKASKSAFSEPRAMAKLTKAGLGKLFFF